MPIAIAIIDVIVCIALVGLVILQEGNSHGLGSIGGSAETFFGQHRGRAMDQTLKRLTTVLAIVFVVLNITLYALTSI